MLERCPRCGSAWVPTVALNGGKSEFWKECSNPSCNAYLNTYVPQPHQKAFHEDAHRFCGNFGAYGTGKTLTSREEVFKHVFLTPNGNTLIGANVSSQYEQTIKRELEADIPAAFIRRISTQKSYIDFINGHRILYRPYDDPEKLRSYNLTSFLILEASEVKQQSFVQLKTRTRNLAASVPEIDPETNEIVTKTLSNGQKVPVVAHAWLKGIIESNPSAGWIRDEVLLNSCKIETYGSILDHYEVDEDRADPAIATHVATTSVNEFLPDDFIANNTKNKPMWWVNRYIYGSFLYAEGMVYPRIREVLCDEFEIPNNWHHIVAFDYGLADDAVFIIGAVDEKEGILYIYDESRSNENNIEVLAKLFKEFTAHVPLGGWITAPIIDPKSGPKRDYNKKSLVDHFVDYGIVFQPGYVNVDARVFRLNTYIESGKIRVFKHTCKALVEELSNYKFQTDESLESGYTGKPVDKNNHGINALEWITMALPANPMNLLYGAYNNKGEAILSSKPEEEQLAYWALSDGEDESHRFMDDTPFDIDYSIL